MDNELRIGMQFLEVKTGIVWRLIDIVDELCTSDKAITFLQDISTGINKDNKRICGGLIISKTTLERRLRTGTWEQINNRKNNYY